MRRAELPLVVGVIALALVSCLPLFDHFFWMTHERTSYVMRVVEYARVLSLEHDWVRWCPDFYGGFGSPFFNYYAPGVYALSALGVYAGLLPTTALKLVVILATLLATVGVLGWVRFETR